MRGRKPKPSKLKVLQGNPGKRKIPDSPEPEVGWPKCPGWLQPKAREMWQLLRTELEAIGYVAHVDLAMLVGYCEAYADLHAAQVALDRDGLFYETEKGAMGPHPAQAMKNRALIQLRSYGSELGLSPASRARVNAPKPRADADDEKARRFFA